MAAEFYSKPTFATGGMYHVYNSSRPQNGSGVLGSVASFLTPMGKLAMRGLSSKIGKKVAAKGAEVLTGVAVDALRGQRVGESMKKRSRDAALEALTSSYTKPAKKLKQKQKKKQAVKRPASVNTSTTRSKKRRVTLPRGDLF